MNRNAEPNAYVSQWVQPTTIAALITWAGDVGKDVIGAGIAVNGNDV